MKEMNYTRVQLAEYLLYHQNQVIPAHYSSTRQRALFTQKWTGYSAANGKHYLNNKEIIFDEDKLAFLDRLVNDPRFEMFSKGWSAVYTFLKERYVNIHQSDVIAALQRSEHHQKYAPSKRPKQIRPVSIQEPHKLIQIDESFFTNGYNLLLAIDASSRYLYGLLRHRNINSDDVRDLVNRINTRLNKPPVFISDNGQIFNIIAETNKHINTSVYRSMANGRVERVHRTIKSTLTQLLAAGEVMSEGLLQRVINNYNNALNQAINKTPVVADTQREVKTVKSVATAHHATYPLHTRVRISMYKLHPELLKDVKYKDSHVQHWSNEIYEIVAIHRPRNPTMAAYSLYYLLANQADTKYYFEDLKLANQSVGLVANVKAKPPKPKPTQKTRIQKAEERELNWEHRRMKTTTEKRVPKPNSRFAI